MSKENENNFRGIFVYVAQGDEAPSFGRDEHGRLIVTSRHEGYAARATFNGEGEEIKAELGVMNSHQPGATEYFATASKGRGVVFGIHGFNYEDSNMVGEAQLKAIVACVYGVR